MALVHVGKIKAENWKKHDLGSVLLSEYAK